MKLKINIAGITRPAGLALLAVTLSFAAWLCPDFGVLRKGFLAPEHPGLITSFILLSWYLLIFTSLSVGQKLGASFSRPQRERINIPSLDSAGVYRTYTILAAVGTISTLFRIFNALPLLQAALYIYIGQANRLKNTLYEGYSAGLLSLRYLILYSASLAIYRMVKFRKLSPLNLANILLLGLTVLISSRLILIATLLISAFLLTYGKRSIRISMVKLAIVASVLFIVLSLLNSSRNSKFYANLNLSFTQAGVSEIVTYLGAPFHVSLGAASRTDEISAGGPDLYRDYIDVEEALTTNSAFVQLHEQMGYLSWPYISVVCCFMGFMFSRLISFGRTSFLLPCGAILYGSAELWRLDLFQQGIFIVWFVMGIGVPAAFAVFGKRSIARKSRPRSIGPTAPPNTLGNAEFPEPQM